MSSDAALARRRPRAGGRCCPTHLVWLDDAALLGRHYRAKPGARTVGATVDAPEHRIDVDSGEHVAAKSPHANEIARPDVHFDAPVGHEPDRINRTSDRSSCSTGSPTTPPGQA